MWDYWLFGAIIVIFCGVFKILELRTWQNSQKKDESVLTETACTV